MKSARSGAAERRSASKQRGRAPKAKSPSGQPHAIHKRFGQRLEMLLEAKGHSQRSFARLCRVTPTNMGHYLSGRIQPGFDVLRRIAAATGVSLDWLVLDGGDDAPIYLDRAVSAAAIEKDVVESIARQIQPHFPHLKLEVLLPRLIDYHYAVARRVADAE